MAPSTEILSRTRITSEKGGGREVERRGRDATRAGQAREGSRGRGRKGDSIFYRSRRVDELLTDTYGPFSSRPTASVLV